MCLTHSKEVHNNTNMTVLAVKYFTYLKHAALDRLRVRLNGILLHWFFSHITIEGLCFYREFQPVSWRYDAEVRSVGSVCTSTCRPAKTRRRQLSTGSTVVHRLFVDGCLPSRAGTIAVLQWVRQPANSEIDLVPAITASCVREMEVSVVRS